MPTVVITGASSGVGAALARRYARERATLGLLGRDEAKLGEVAAACREQGATVETAALDVRARPEMAQWISDFDRRSPIDVVIANAGVMTGTPPGGEIEAADAAHALIEINVLGVLNTVQPVIPAMVRRRAGQIVIVSSLAAFVPLADAPAYSASKAAVLNYGLSLRGLLAREGVRVNVVCPGYVTTPMSRQELGSKPFEMDVGRAADLILRGIARNDAMIVFPFGLGLATRFGGILPDWLQRRVLEYFRFKVEARK